jgi:predicted DCC family thiol-disulfide oxidoreductase YuxK
MRRIWWAYPLYLISVAPVSRLVFDWGYRTFAANRYRISGACRLKPAPDGEPRATTDNNQTQRSPTQATGPRR